jgi:RNA polymerase sigma factor (sigma-70 family)
VSETTARQAQTQAAGRDATAEFERLYRSQIESVTAFFARRSTDPQTVADLTAETFVRVITSFGTFDPRKGTARAWVFGIAQRVYAAHCEDRSRQQSKVQRLAGRRELDADQVGELLDRIDAERDGQALISALTALPALDRAVVELVDIAGLRTKEAASVLGLSAGAARMRLMRARARLRKTTERNHHDLEAQR